MKKVNLIPTMDDIPCEELVPNGNSFECSLFNAPPVYRHEWLDPRWNISLLFLPATRLQIHDKPKRAIAHFVVSSYEKHQQDTSRLLFSSAGGMSYE